MVVLLPVVTSNGLRAARSVLHAWVQSPIHPHNHRQQHQFIACIYIQQSGRSVKTMNDKNTKKKSPIHENADANITCDFGDGDISRRRSRLPASHIVSSIIVRFHFYTRLSTWYSVFLSVSFLILVHLTFFLVVVQNCHHFKAKIFTISSQTHQLEFIKPHHFKLDRFKSI